MAEDSTGAEALTVDSPQVISVFMGELSDEEEGSAPAETPQAKEQVAEATAEAESTEQDEAHEAESPEQAEEKSEESDGQPEPSAATDKYKVKVDGDEVEVTLDELAKGYSRTADYTRKTQELAERRKALEAESQAARMERIQLAEHLRLLEQTVAEVTPKEPDWEKIRTEHPDRFAAIWAEWQQGEKDRAELRAQREAAEKKVAEDRQAEQAQRIQAERQKLLAAIPEWSKDDVRKAEKQEMQAYAETMGFSAQDLAGIEDHRALVLLRKAMLFDKGQAKKPTLIQKIDAIRTTKPGGQDVTPRPKTELQKALSRLAKERTQEAATSVFLHALDD